MSQILDFSRWASLNGLGASAYESRPDLVSQAQKLLTAAGFPARCREFVTVFPDQSYYNRVCSVTCPSGKQTPEEYGADLVVASGGVEVARPEIMAACAFLDAGQPWAQIEQYMVGANPPPAQQQQAVQTPPPPAKPYTPTVYPKWTPTPEPGPARGTPTGSVRTPAVIQEHAGGLQLPGALQTAVETGQQFIDDSGVPWWVWIAAAAGLAYVVAKQGNRQ